MYDAICLWDITYQTFRCESLLWLANALKGCRVYWIQIRVPTWQSSVIFWSGPRLLYKWISNPKCAWNFSYHLTMISFILYNNSRDKLDLGPGITELQTLCIFPPLTSRFIFTIVQHNKSHCLPHSSKLECQFPLVM